MLLFATGAWRLVDDEQPLRATSPINTAIATSVLKVLIAKKDDIETISTLIYLLNRGLAALLGFRRLLD